MLRGSRVDLLWLSQRSEPEELPGDAKPIFHFAEWEPFPKGCTASGVMRECILRTAKAENRAIRAPDGLPGVNYLEIPKVRHVRECPGLIRQPRGLLRFPLQ